MICPLFQAAQTVPDRPFLIAKDQEWTYQDWDHQAQGISVWLQSQNLPLGSRIGIQHRSNFSTASWLIGCARAGMILVIFSDRDPTDTITSLGSRYNINTIIAPEDADPPTAKSESPEIHPRTPLNILFTSGSTGYPKAVVHCFDNHWHSAQGSAANIPYQQGDRWLLSLSLWHIGGLAILFRTLQGKATAIVRNSTMSLAQQIQVDRISHVSVVAVQLQEILNDHYDLSSIEHLLIGGGPIPPSLIQKSILSNIPVHTTYGMTELSSQLTTTPSNTNIEILQSAGYPIGDWKVKIDLSGEICVYGSALFLGYWTGTLIDPNRDDQGFFHTKDTGIIKDDCLIPIGRIDQMFISGGENIHPEEIERVLCKIVQTATVVPIPHSKYGFRPVAFVKGSWDMQELKQLLAQRLPSFKHPDHYLPWPEQYSTHKPSRAKLQKLAISILCTN